MARDPLGSMHALVRLRRVRMLQAQARLAQLRSHAEAANREVAETQALVEEYALKNLGVAAVPAVLRQQLFAGKVQELVASRQQQAARLDEETARREAVWRQTITSLRSAEKVLDHVEEIRRVEEERKLRRRSIHRPPATGRWTVHKDPD